MARGDSESTPTPNVRAERDEGQDEENQRVEIHVAVEGRAGSASVEDLYR